MNDQIISSLSQLTFMLVAMVGFILSIGWLAKRTGGFGLQTGKQICIIESLSLGSKEKAVLIDLNGKKILLGVTPMGINSLWVGSEERLSSDLVEKEEFSESLKKMLTKDVAVK